VTADQQVTKLIEINSNYSKLFEINQTKINSNLRGPTTSDGDEQFQAYHQDIGRISGSNGAQVAAQTTIVERAQQQQQSGEPAGELPAAEAPALSSAAAAPQAPRRAHNNRLSPTGSRKPNRITLVARRDPLPSASAALAATPTQLAAPLGGNQFGFQPAQQQAPAQQETGLAALQQPSSFSAPALVQPLRASAQLAAHNTQTNGAQAHTQAASTLVSARHSALMAQVAAERAAAEALAEPQASLGEPQGSLSSVPLSVPQSQAQSQAQFQPQPLAASSQTAARYQSQPAIENPSFVAASAAEEPLPAPSFEQVLSSGCPQKGVHSWENRDHCDRYYMCTNGTFTEETCPNGLAYSQMGAVYQHCAYNWNVDCGRKKSPQPIASQDCPWQFGIFPILQNGRCSIDYYVCEWGVPEAKRCSPEGLFYDDRIKGCQWADQLGCKSENLLNFKCPAEDEDNPYWPYPRYYHTTRDVIVCVNEQPRLVHCNEDQLVDPSSLACVETKKKKKFSS